MTCPLSSSTENVVLGNTCLMLPCTSSGASFVFSTLRDGMMVLFNQVVPPECLIFSPSAQPGRALLACPSSKVRLEVANERFEVANQRL